ncbi:Uma2 family endonuclease [Sorangium sp. So ce295]|uniref:Uma2 family endonuclease n=1 Tax=Sorangium sp. So ce295 TaxID=3133295 RepID=UPI003F5E9011
MVQALPAGYLFDPADPRAPTSEQWARMTPAERARVVDMLPAEVPLELMPPEGDAHRKAKRDALDALDGFFRRTARKIYLSSELAVFYPGEPRFAPDLLAVVDVEPHERMRWVVDHEGKGLDLVIEVHVAGSRTKDHKLNVDRYARLGIHEYFLFDRARLRLHAYRLPAAAAQESDPSRPRAYQRIVPQAGRFASEVLGLDLLLDGTRLRFFAGNAPLEDTDERIARLGGMLDQVISHQEDAQRIAEELAAELDRERRLREEEQRLREGEQRLREETERQLAQARAEIERLKSR